MANSGRSSLAATRALTDWGTSGAVWLLVLSAGTTVTDATAVALAAVVSGASVILTVLQRGYSRKVGVGRVFEHRIVMRASLLSGTVVVLIDQQTGPTIGIATAVLATLLATGAVQAGRFVVDRMETQLRERGSLADRVIVLGDGSDATDVLDLIAAHAEAGWTILGCVGECESEATDRGVAYIGASDDLVQTVETTAASIVIATVDALRSEATYTQLLALRRAGTDVRVHAGLRGIDHREVRAGPDGTRHPALPRQPPTPRLPTIRQAAARRHAGRPRTDGDCADPGDQRGRHQGRRRRTRRLPSAPRRPQRRDVHDAEAPVDERRRRAPRRRSQAPQRTRWRTVVQGGGRSARDEGRTVAPRLEHRRTPPARSR